MDINKRKSRILSATPTPVIRTLKKLGQDVRDARIRRRIPVAILAERASISRTTLSKVERGDPGVSLGIFATILFSLGMIDRLSDLVDSTHDSVGLDLDEERLPKRIRLSQKKSSKPSSLDQQ